MNVNKMKLHHFVEGSQAAENRSPGAAPARRWPAAASLVIALILAHALSASAQTSPPQAPQNPCPTEMIGQPLVKVPEIVSNHGKLRGTVIVGDEQEWIAFRIPVAAPSPTSTSQCFPQYVRTFRIGGLQPLPPANGFGLPLPGPTLRARVGDLVQLTFLNQINAADFGDSIDRGETGRGGGCDESSSGYPGSDSYPDCFHGSSTANIHFHGTHTNMNSTGDNVFIEVRPSLRVGNKPIVTEQSVRRSFNRFFDRCEAELSTNVLKQWPRTWSDLPRTWTFEQQRLLKRYDRQLERDYGSGVRKLWPIDAEQLKQGAWPQYYIGAYPYCFRLPEYTSTSWPPPADHAAHTGAGSAEQQEIGRPLMMGQSPGTHWYHAHKHGSTAINVANGMTGVFIIEGKYDDDLNDWYGAEWTRKQPVMVVNQLGVSPNLLRGPTGRQDKGPDFSVNGRLKPVVEMQPGEVQMWRIANTSGRAGAFFASPPQGFEWKQLAQDGVQFNDANYQRALNIPFLVAAGNRVDLLVKAPATRCTTAGGCTYPVLVQNEVDPSDLATANKVTLLSVNVSGDPVAPTSHEAQFIPNAPSFPPFLADITSDEVKGTQTIVFASSGPGKPFPQANHTINGKKFGGEVGAVVLLNTVEEWKVVNETYGPPIAHPFHIHINPFQVVEVFNPNEALIDPQTGKPPIDPQTGKPYIDPQTRKPAVKYAFHANNLAPGQCPLDPDNPESWKPCDTPPQQTNLIWWDVFPIPSGYAPTTDAAGKNPLLNSKGQPVKAPGYFKMRSRFVDYSGYYVLHCHILAHEDRGMMTVVEVAPARSPYSHH